MTVKEAYEEFKHLDACLSDPEFPPDSKDCNGCKLGRTLAGIASQLWLAVKEQEQSK